LPVRKLFWIKRQEQKIFKEKSDFKGEKIMSTTMFMRVEEVAEEMGVSVPYAYKLIRKLNTELKTTGCITIAGRIDRNFFHEKFYSTKTQTKGEI